jgi:hypothetical protein
MVVKYVITLPDFRHYAIYGGMFLRVEQSVSWASVRIYEYDSGILMFTGHSAAYFNENVLRKERGMIEVTKAVMDSKLLKLIMK